MAHFRKKPVMIEAVQFDSVDYGDHGGYSIQFNTVADLPKWLRDALINDDIFAHEADPDFIFIKTAEGLMESKPGDWIIRGVKGELYPCKPEIFAMTYDPVDEQDIEVTGVAI